MSTYVEPGRPKPYGPIYLADTEPPEPPPETDMTTDEAVAIATTPIPPDIAIGALTRFRNESCWPRDQIPEPYTDQVTGGAAAFYFWPIYHATVSGRLLREGVPSGSPEQVYQRWADYSTSGLIDAQTAYWTAQGNPHDPNWTPGPGPTPPPSGATGIQWPVSVSGRDFQESA